MSPPFIKLSELKRTPATRQLAVELKAADKNRDGKVDFKELAPLSRKLRNAAADHFSGAEPAIAPVEPAGPLSATSTTRFPTRPEDRNRAVATASDALLVGVQARNWLKHDVLPDALMGHSTWALRSLARLVELSPKDQELRALVGKLLSDLDPGLMGLAEPAKLSVVKRLAAAAGHPLSEVRVQIGGNKYLPLAGFERLLSQRQGLSIVELLKDPNTRALGQKLMHAELDRGDQDGFLGPSELKGLPKQTRAQLEKVLEARAAPAEVIEAEAARPISRRTPEANERLPVNGSKRIHALKDIPDAVLLDGSTRRNLLGSLQGGADEASNPYVLRAFARTCELAEGSKDSSLLSTAAQMKRLLGPLLTSGKLTAVGLANAPARDSLAIVLRAAKAAGVEADQVRVLIGGGSKLTLKELQQLLGDLDLVPIIEGDTQPAAPPVRVPVKEAPNPWNWFDSPSTGPAIGGGEVRTLNDSFWSNMHREIFAPDWSYYGGPAAPREMFPTPAIPAPPPAPTFVPGVAVPAPPAFVPAAPVAVRYGYVNPWQFLADPRASGYLKAVRLQGYNDGWLEYMRQNPLR